MRGGDCREKAVPHRYQRIMREKYVCWLTAVWDSSLEYGKMASSR